MISWIAGTHESATQSYAAPATKDRSRFNLRFTHLIGWVRSAVFRSSTTLFLISISSSSKANKVCICRNGVEWEYNWMALNSWLISVECGVERRLRTSCRLAWTHYFSLLLEFRALTVQITVSLNLATVNRLEQQYYVFPPLCKRMYLFQLFPAAQIIRV